MQARVERRWVGFAISVGMHAAAAVATMAYPLGMTVIADGTNRRDLAVRVVELAEEVRTAPLIYRPPAGMQMVRSRPAQADAGRRRAAGHAILREAGASAAAGRGEQLLIQPDTRVVADEALRVPRITLMEPRSTLRTFIRPPDRPVPADVPRDVVVELAPPSLTGVAQGMAGRSAVLREAVLTAPAALRAPVAGAGNPTQEPQLSSVRGALSEPATIVSVPDRELPGSRVIAVPTANMAGTGGEAGTAGAGVRGRQQIVGGTGAAGKQVVDAATRGGRMTAQAQTIGSEPGVHGQNEEAVRKSSGSTETEVAAAKSAGTAASSGGVSAAAPGMTASAASPAQVLNPAAVRIVRPLEGVQDFVVTQSESAIPGSAGLLGCRPVYTVYVPVGTARDWILQYCTPAIPRAAGEREVRVVTLGRAEAVTAPYAHVVIRPAVRLKVGARYAFVHGYVNADGRLEKVSEAGGSWLEEPAAVAGALALWEFRPAMKDGVATEVEVLLCIPRS